MLVGRDGADDEARRCRRLRKVDLLGLLVSERRRTEELEAEVAALKEELARRSLEVDRAAGSLIEAAAAVNGVLDAVRRAAADRLGDEGARGEGE